MGALERAQLDEEAGDLGSARRRLLSVIGSSGFDAEVCEAIARLSVRMGDLTEAGRWYLLCDSSDSRAQECMSRFIASCGGNPAGIAAQLPRLRRATKQVELLEALPEVVTRRLKSLNVPVVAGRPTSPRESGAGGGLVAFGCMLALVLAVACAAIGAATVMRWIFGLF